ncbi:hypothetical protein E8E14_011982 [Neopestalotiopsis sp. 37M]|nr:hypothetical protein E8E14_011982 [Neopestalotiopsis sp. 37M]
MFGPSTVLASLVAFLQLQPAKAADDSWPISDSGYTDVVQWDHYSFIINGERKYLFGGEMHPFRWPVPEIWQDIIQKFKASGMNIFSFYGMWGMHENFPSEVDFSTAFRDYGRLLGYAEDAGLYVMARPGPYSNAELSGGGFPIWVTTGAYGTLRTNDTRYTAAWQDYMKAVTDIIRDHQIHKNGTVISIQVDNEFPSQYKDHTTLTLNGPGIGYMENLEALIRAQGVEVPTTHNAPGHYPDWSKDFDTVGAGGDVNVWGLDSYPLCWSCNPDDCSSANDEFTLLEYYDYFQSVAPNQPGLMPEFQGGRVVSLGAESCEESVGPDFRNVYYRHNIDQKISAQIMYMFAGGTNWGWIGVPFIGSSYDYSAPIAEDRTLRDSWYETKSLALFTRVAQDLAKVDRNNETDVVADNDAVSATELRNPDTGAAFYVVRHATSTEDSAEEFHMNVTTSIGSLVIPQVISGLPLSGYIAKIVVTDFTFADQQLIYSTAEVFSYVVIDNTPVLIFWLPAGESGEFLLKDAEDGETLNCNGCSNVAFNQTADGVITTFTQGEGTSLLRVGDVRVLLLDRFAAWKTFLPVLTNDPSAPVDQTIIVQGPYLIREAGIDDTNGLHVHGDTNTTTEVEIFAPSSVNKLWWNGKSTSFTRSSYGSLKVTVSGPESYELPPLGDWKTHDALPERFVNYSATSEAWVSADKGLYVDLYGPHHGFSLWHGTFNGSATGGVFEVQGGRGFAFSAYLNGQQVGSYAGDSEDASSSLTVSFEDAIVESDGENIILLVQDNTGHDESSRATTPRGILSASLNDTSEDIQWKLAGTVGAPTNTTVDTVRGPYNEGGLVAERLGWHLPGFDDGAWSTGSPAEGVTEPAIQFYRTLVDLDVPEGHDASIVFTLSTNSTTETARALLYVNGYQYGRYMPYVGSTSRFPVPPGILDYSGQNTIAIALWAQDDEGASLDVTWEITSITRSSLDTRFDGSYLRPGWSDDRDIYY